MKSSSHQSNRNPWDFVNGEHVVRLGLALALCSILVLRWDPPVHPLVLAAPVKGPNASVLLSAREILDGMVARYGQCRSYRDTGVVRDVWSGWPQHTTQRPFDTAFVRGGRFRFGFVDQPKRSVIGLFTASEHRMVVWGTPESAKSWWTVRDGKVEKGSLDWALRGAYGVSGRSSQTVPRLLLPNSITGTRVDRLERGRVEGIEIVGGHECYKLASNSSGESTELWIDRESFLLRRIREVLEINGKTIEVITAYDPVIDVEIPPAALEFEPPR